MFAKTGMIANVQLQENIKTREVKYEQFLIWTRERIVQILFCTLFCFVQIKRFFFMLRAQNKERLEA